MAEDAYIRLRAAREQGLLSEDQLARLEKYEKRQAYSRLQQAAAKGELSPEQQARFEKIDPSTFAPETTGAGAVARGAVQGATLGFGDEIAGAAESMFTDKSYDQALAQHRAADQFAQLNRPGAYMGGEIGGAMAGALIPGGAAMAFPRALGALAAARPGVGLGRAMTTSAGLGAAAEGARGFGLGEGQDDRINQAAQGALIGGSLGAALPVVGKGVGAVARRVRNRFGPTADNMSKATMRRLGRVAETHSPGSPNAIAAARQQAQALGPEATLADLGGEFQGNAVAAARVAGARGGHPAQQVFAERAAGAPARVAGALDEIAPAGASDDILEGTQQFKRGLSQEYEALLDAAPPVNVWEFRDALRAHPANDNPAAQRIIDKYLGYLPRSRRGADTVPVENREFRLYVDGQRVGGLGVETRPRGREVYSFVPMRGSPPWTAALAGRAFNNVEDLESAVGMAAVRGGYQPLITARRAHELRSSFNDEIAALQQQGKNAPAAVLTRVKPEFDRLTATIPGYGSLTQEYAQQLAREGAVDMGRGALKTGVSRETPQAAVRQIQEMDPTLMGPYRAGMREAFDRRTGTAAMGDRAAEGMVDLRWNRPVMDAALGQDVSGRVAQRLGTEQTFRDTSNKVNRALDEGRAEALAQEMAPGDPRGSTLFGLGLAGVNRAVDMFVRRPQHQYQIAAGRTVSPGPRKVGNIQPDTAAALVNRFRSDDVAGEVLNVMSLTGASRDEALDIVAKRIGFERGSDLAAELARRATEQAGRAGVAGLQAGTQ